PFYFLPTGLMLPEPAGGDPRILLDGGNAPSPDVERRVAAAITPNAAARRRGRRPDTAHGGSRARWCCRVAHRERRDVPPAACRWSRRRIRWRRPRSIARRCRIEG